MTMDPTQRASWRGFLDLLRPPPGYSVAAAFGTTFGLTLDALVASLFAYLDTDAESRLHDPLAGLLAATRLSDRVRVMVQAGSISGATAGLPARIATLLERLIIPVNPAGGLFHPKLLVIQYSPMQHAGKERVRLIVGSRNLTSSRAFEMAMVIDGVADGRGSQLGTDVAAAILACFRLSSPKCKRVEALLPLLKQTAFDCPSEAEELCRLHFQGVRGPGHGTRLPSEADRLLLLSPFLSREFLVPVLERARTVRIISTPEAYRKLDAKTFSALQERAKQQRCPVTYVMVDDFGDDEVGHIDGIHAKLVMTEHSNQENTRTFLGSANATGPGWGLAGQNNVESMLELRPGSSMTRFLKDFVLEKGGANKPWIREFEARDKSPLTDEEKLRGEILGLARSHAARRFHLTYDLASTTLEVRLLDLSGSLVPNQPDVLVEFIPLGVLETIQDWRPLEDLAERPALFVGVELSLVNAFVLVRATSGDASVTRMAFAEVELSDQIATQREAEARDHLMATVSSEDIIAALIFGIAHSREVTGNRRTSSRGSASASALLETVSIERLLHAVAANPDVLREMDLLLASRTDDSFARFRRDIAEALGVVEGSPA